MLLKILSLWSLKLFLIEPLQRIMSPFFRLRELSLSNWLKSQSLNNLFLSQKSCLNLNHPWACQISLTRESTCFLNLSLSKRFCSLATKLFKIIKFRSMSATKILRWSLAGIQELEILKMNLSHLRRKRLRSKKLESF